MLKSKFGNKLFISPEQTVQYHDKKEKMKIIDFHTHTFPDRIAEGAIANLSAASNTVPFSDGTVSGLEKCMKEDGVDLSVVLPVVTNPVKAQNINHSAAEINKKTEETGIFSLGGIHPDTPDYKAVLDQVKALGLKGIKLHPDYVKVEFNDIRMKRIMAYASEIGLIIVTHAGLDIGLYPPVFCTVDQILDVVREVQPEKLVLAHMGGWQLWDEVVEKLADKKVYLDTAFSIGDFHWVKEEEKKDFRMLTDDEFVNMVRVFGSARILFATDSPWASAGDYVERIGKMPLTDEEKEDIFHRNAERLLDL